MGRREEEGDSSSGHDDGGGIFVEADRDRITLSLSVWKQHMETRKR